MTGSRISGQAVLEGVLMKNNSKYALAVRKPNDDIEVLVERCSSISEKNTFFTLPFIRGIVHFFEGIYLGCKNFSALGKSYDREDTEENELLQLLIVVAIISLAIGTFIILPYGLSLFFGSIIGSGIFMVIIEGVIRLILLVLYLIGISMLPDIKRFYMYLGASHKVMKCIQNNIPLTISNVRRMSRKSSSCDTVFVLTVMILSIILFMFVRFDNAFWRIAVRLFIIPVVAAFVYEAGVLSEKIKNPITKFLNLPSILVQTVISDEPAEEMIEVAIKSAAAVLGEDVGESETIRMPEKSQKKKAETKSGIKRVSKQKQENIKSNSKEKTGVNQTKSKELSERAKLAVSNKDNKKVSVHQGTKDEDDEILNALNHFFNSKKMEETNRRKRK